MGARSQATTNPMLTNFATGIAQDVSSRLAEFFAPTVDTGGAIIGRHKKYDEKNAFQALDYARALGGGFKRIDFAESDGSFDCKPVGLEIPLDDDEVSEGADRQRLDEAKIKTLIITQAVSREKKVIDKINASVSALADFGKWSDPDVDPVAELDAVIEAIAKDLGAMPNRIGMDLGPWKVAKNHPKVLARQPGSLNQGVTLQQFAAMLLNPQIEIRTSILTRDIYKFGKTKSVTSILGNRLYVFYASQTATQYDASFAKTFATRLGNVETVETYREESSTSDIHRVRWSEDIQICTSVAGRRIDLS